MIISDCLDRVCWGRKQLFEGEFMYVGDELVILGTTCLSALNRHFPEQFKKAVLVSALNLAP